MGRNYAQHTSLGQGPVAHRAETGEVQYIRLLWPDSAAGEENLGRTDSAALLEQFRHESRRSGTPNDMIAGPDD